MASESTQLRLDAAWEAAEHEANNDNIMKNSSQLGDDDGDQSSTPSPLTSSLEYDASAPPPSQLNGSSSDDTTTTTLYYDDPFLLPSNETSPTSLASSSSLTQHHHHSTSLHKLQQQCDQTSSSAAAPPTLLTRYKILLQTHSSLLTLIEMIMERFIFYGHLFKSNHHNNDDDDEERGILKMEMYYATFNVIRWINDVVLVGVGEGMGLTVGTRGEWLHCNINNININNNEVSLNQWIASKINTLIPIIRATLTATTCIYPAVEAFSRRSIIRSNHHYYQLEKNEWNNRRYRAALTSYRLERVRFMGRMCLLVISWWGRLQRRRQHHHQQQQQQQQSQDENNNDSILPTVLQRGGELDPYEELVPLKDAEDEASVVQYVGRRTGRRSISSIGSSSSSPFHLQQGLVYSVLSKNIPLFTKATNLIEWISKRFTSSGKKLAYVYAIGEILHIVRPLYWSRAECSEWQRKLILLPQQQQQKRRGGGGVTNSWSIWKAWWVSLFMDLISDRLLRLTTTTTTSGGEGGDTGRSNSSRQGGIHRRSSFMAGGRRGGKQQRQQQQQQQQTSPSFASPQQQYQSYSAEEAKLVELEWRRSRHKLYLLRSPMYDVVTRPVTSFIARIVSMIPSMGFGRWAAEYVLDVMSYWNDNHFMLES